MPPNNRELVGLVAREQQAQAMQISALIKHVNVLAHALQDCQKRLHDLEQRNEQEDERRRDADKESEDDATQD